MTDLICRTSMMRCQTPGMCAPHGGCHAVPFPSVASIIGVKCAQCSKHYPPDSYNAGYMLANKGVCHGCTSAQSEMSWCGCGDGYPKGSLDAGFMDASGGICQNCAAAKPQATSDKAPELPIRPVVDWRVWAVGDTVRYLGSGGDEDRWCHARMTIDGDYLIHEAPDEHESMLVLDDDGDEISVLVGEFEFVSALGRLEDVNRMSKHSAVLASTDGAMGEISSSACELTYLDGKAGDMSEFFKLTEQIRDALPAERAQEVALVFASEEQKALYAQWVKHAAENPVDDSGALCGG